MPYELFFVKLINGVWAFLILLLPREIYSPREFLSPDKLKIKAPESLTGCLVTIPADTAHSSLLTAPGQTWAWSQ